MSVSSDVQAALEREQEKLANLKAEFDLRKAAILSRIDDLKAAKALITPQIDAVAEKLNLIIKT